MVRKRVREGRASKDAPTSRSASDAEAVVSLVVMCSEPTARRTIFAGFRHAALEVFGQAGLDEIASTMSEEARSVCLDPIVIHQEMLPERFVLEWYECTWAGPASRDRATYNRFLDRMMDHGFGRVRKLLLGLATPAILAQKAPDLWRHDHSHGVLTFETLGPHSVQARLSDHAYVESPLARSSIAEIYRYAMSLTRAKAVTARHFLADERTLSVHIEWQS